MCRGPTRTTPVASISLSFARKLRGEGSQLSQPCALAQLPHLILRVSVVGRGPSAYRTSSKVACYDILFSSCGLAKLATRPAVPAGTPTSQVRVAGSSLRAIAVGAAGEPSRPSQTVRTYEHVCTKRKICHRRTSTESTYLTNLNSNVCTARTHPVALRYVSSKGVCRSVNVPYATMFPYEP